MINYTTPTIDLIVEGNDITAYEIYATLEQGINEITKHGDDLTVTTERVGQITNTKVSLTLTQAESASFDYTKPVGVQVNWIDAQGTRGATKRANITVERNLLDRVIEYGN